MTITIHWQHWILIIGLPLSWWLSWRGYGSDGDDRYGIGALICGTQWIVTSLLVLCIFFGLHYFGAFT